MFANLLYYRYPQFIWAQEINKILESGLIKNLTNATFIDAPCGDGIISYWVHKKFPTLNLDLYDLDKSLVRRAHRYCRNSKTHVQSIFDISLNGESNVWMLINSLYCLPDKDVLLSRLEANVEYIIGVFPHTDRTNYQAFITKHLQFENPNAMSQEATISFFLQHGFKHIFLKDVTFIPHFALRGLQLPVITKRFLNIADRFSAHREGCYWLAVFVKTATHPPLNTDQD